MENRQDVRVVRCAGPGPVRLATLKFRDQEYEGNAMINHLQKLPQSEILIYQTQDGRTRIEVRLQGETVWMTQAAMAELYQTTPQNITLHLKAVYQEGELEPQSTCKEFLQVQSEGSRNVSRNRKFYNLPAIIAVGYRVRSHRGNQFRRWATERLNEYLVKGFTMDDERLKARRNIGSDYFDELLERIRDIRSSENDFTRKSATSINWRWTTTPRPRRPKSFSVSSRTSCILPLQAKPPPS